MNYIKIYNNIIIKATKRNEPDGYYESHHIIPRSLKGTNDSYNIVKLTSREHFICHYLLAKMYHPQTFEWYKMNHAFMMMKTSPTSLGRYFNSRLYESLRINFSATMAFSQQGKKNSQHNTRWIYNMDLQKSKKLPKGDALPQGWDEGRKIRWQLPKKSCKNCNIDFEYTSQNIRICSKKCKTEYAGFLQTKNSNNVTKLVNSIAIKYTIIFSTLTKNKEFIIEAVSAGISLRQICYYLKCNDSGGNYNTIKSIISK